jgi:uncharacterized protein (TIGR03382 family)
VYAQELDLEEQPPGTASCDDLTAVPLVVLTVEVDPYAIRKHYCGCWPPEPPVDPCDPENPKIVEGDGEAAFQLDEAMPVLVCIDSDGVQAGTVSMNEARLVGTDELNSTVEHLEVRSQAQQGENSIEAWIKGYCGATLTVRVLADPGAEPPIDDPDDGDPDGGDSDDNCPHGHCLGGCGCVSGGAASIWVLAGLALLWARRARKN